MVQARVRIAPAEGLHARPAAEFVRLAAKGSVTLTRADGKVANGASILEVLTLGLKQGDFVTIRVSGPNAETLLSELVALLG